MTLFVTDSWVKILIVLLPGLLFNSVTIYLVVTENKLPRAIRLVLVNILSACIVVGLSGILIDTLTLIISWRPEIKPDAIFCHFFVWQLLTGGACRLSFMATFAVVVYYLVRYGETKVKLGYLAICIAVIWIAAISFNGAVFSEQVLLVNSLPEINCSPHSQENGYGIGFIIVYVLIFGILVYVITVGIPIRTMYYIKKHSITGDTKAKKALVKFSLFLLIGNSIGFLGQIVPLISSSLPGSKDKNTIEITLYVFQGYLFWISLIPTPILILLYFKVIRDRILKCFRRKKDYIVKNTSRESMMKKSTESTASSNIKQ